MASHSFPAYIADRLVAPPPTDMEYARLGNSGLKVSKIILGAMSYGSKNWAKWIIEEEEALPLLEHAYKVGINTWDTVGTLALNIIVRLVKLIFYSLIFIPTVVRKKSSEKPLSRIKFPAKTS